MINRENKRLQSRLKKARLDNASIEGIDFRAPRGLDKELILSLSSCRWIRDHNNVIIMGQTGIGKTYIASALANQACRDGYSAYKIRISTMLDELAISKADGRYRKLMHAYSRIDVLIVDDWGIAGMSEMDRRIVFDLVEERYQMRSTIIVSQMPLEKWHTIIGDPTLADAILDRIVHCSHKMTLKGDSMRRKKKPGLDSDSESR
jgi:DNA replication protein DnaC